MPGACLCSQCLRACVDEPPGHPPGRKDGPGLCQIPGAVVVDSIALVEPVGRLPSGLGAVSAVCIPPRAVAAVDASGVQGVLMKARGARVAFLAATLLAVTVLTAPCVLPLRTRIVFNPSASMARGWYRVDAVSAPGAVRASSLVLARLPASAAALAAQRHYLPAGTPVLKRVAAVAPQSVCIARQRVRIDAKAVAVVRLHDGVGRSLPIWTHCGPLAHGELFLLGDAQPVSFDSRYFGPVRVDAVLGVAHPLWTW